MTLDDIIETFEALDPGEERYRYLIDLGKAVQGLPEDDKTEATRVHGCQSRVWLVLTVTDGRLHIGADSDAFIVRGLLAVLLAIYDGQPVEIARAADAKAVFEQIGLEGHLSMGRRNGLYAMIQRIQAAVA